MGSVNLGGEKQQTALRLFLKKGMESFWQTPPACAISRTVAPFFNTHKHLFWPALWLGSVERGRVSTRLSGVPVPKAKLLGSAAAAAQASRFTLPATFAQTWMYHLPPSEEQFPLTLLRPEIHRGKYHKSCRTEQNY